MVCSQETEFPIWELGEAGEHHHLQEGEEHRRLEGEEHRRLEGEEHRRLEREEHRRLEREEHQAREALAPRRFCLSVRFCWKHRFAAVAGLQWYFVVLLEQEQS